jgi:hypothetical protein
MLTVPILAATGYNRGRPQTARSGVQDLSLAFVAKVKTTVSGVAMFKDFLPRR